MIRSQPNGFIINGEIIIKSPYKPFKFIRKDSKTHKVIQLTNDHGLPREKDFRPIVWDNLPRSVLLRRLETTGVIARVGYGRYSITAYGRQSLRSLKETNWDNQFYDKQINDIKNDSRWIRKSDLFKNQGSRTRPVSVRGEISPVYKPYKKVKATSNAHEILEAMMIGFGDVYKHISLRQGWDNMHISTVLRKMETTGLIKRVCRGYYTMTGVGCDVYHMLFYHHEWYNELYKDQMNNVENNARKTINLCGDVDYLMSLGFTEREANLCLRDTYDVYSEKPENLKMILDQIRRKE